MLNNENSILDRFNIEIRYLKRTRRATIRLLPNKLIKVTAPFGVNETEVKKILLQKSKWILKRHFLLEKIENTPKIQFLHNEFLPFLEKKLQLKIIERNQSVIENNSCIFVSVPSNKNNKELFIKTSLIKWYQAEALKIIKLRVEHYSRLLGVSSKSVSIKNYKSRWGACSSKGDLIFNWQIITFSPNLFNYVIAHEICHLKEMNHSKRFYEHLVQLGFNRRDLHPQIRHLRNLF